MSFEESYDSEKWLPKSEPGYAKFRFDLIQRIRDEGLLPDQVADVLEAAKQEYPQILRSEIETYRAWRDVWNYYPGSIDFMIHGTIGVDAEAKVRHRLREKSSPYPSPMEVKAAEQGKSAQGLMSIELCEAIMEGLTPAQAEPLLEKRYENLRPNFSGPDVDEAWFNTKDGRLALERWTGRR